MDRIGRADPPFVLGTAGFGGQLAGLLAIELGKLPRGRVDPTTGIRIWLDEQPAAHDLKRLLRTCRSPVLGNARHDVLKTLESGAAVGSADLKVGGSRFLAITADVRCRN